jgi:outer membrane biosynthesis protein TonB
MNKIDELIAQYCPNGVEYKKLGEVCKFQRGNSITQKDVTEGDVPVIAGGQKPSYYHNKSNRTEEARKEKEKIAEELRPKEEAEVEQMPQFPGGQEALMKYLSENVRYPVIAQENGIEGRVICSFVVERDGSITDVQVVRGVDPSLDREAVRVI